MAEWYGVADEASQERVLADWPDAPLDQLNVCEMILETAREQVIAYAPEPPADSVQIVDGLLVSTFVIPMRYVYAQLQQSVNLWNAGRASGEGQVMGGEAFSFTPRPLDKTIRAIIRPIDGKPHVL